MSSYVPPHKRFAASATKTLAKDKKEHRDLFPVLRNEAGQTMMPAARQTPIISWSGISFNEEDVIHEAPVDTLKYGWVRLSTYVPDLSTTTAQLRKCAENMEDNYRRYFWERGLEIPLWITENPYEQYQDFDRKIPYETDYMSETESSSEGEDPFYESDTSS